MLVARSRYDMEREEQELDHAWSIAMESSEYVAEMTAMEFPISPVPTRKRPEEFREVALVGVAGDSNPTWA